MSLAITITELRAATSAHLSIETLLKHLCRVGKPMLWRTDTHWVCLVTMHVAEKGATFEVRCDHNVHEEARAAVHQCAERAVSALEKFRAP